MVDFHLKPKIDQMKSIKQNKIVFKQFIDPLSKDKNNQFISRRMVGSRELIEDAITAREEREHQEEIERRHFESKNVSSPKC